MQIFKPLIFLLFFLSSCFLDSLMAQNTLKGKVIMPGAQKASVKLGGIEEYNAGGPKSDLKRKLDKENHPDRNVVLSLHPLDFSPTVLPLNRATLTQKEKTFIPHVLPVTRGSVIYIMNEDEFYHNVHSKKPHGLFNIGRRKAGVEVPVKIRRTGLIRVGCNEHEEMSGFILSLDTPYFTKVDESGNYTLEGLPNGKYQLKVFHPSMKRPAIYGEMLLTTGKVTIKDINLSRP